MLDVEMDVLYANHLLNCYMIREEKTDLSFLDHDAVMKQVAEQIQSLVPLHREILVGFFTELPDNITPYSPLPPDVRGNIRKKGMAWFVGQMELKEKHLKRVWDGTKKVEAEFQQEMGMTIREWVREYNNTLT